MIGGLPSSSLCIGHICRKNFDKWWKGTWTTVKIPGKGTIYDYFVNFKTSKFTPWTDLVTDIDYESSMPMSSLFVPTAETSSLRFFLDLMVNLKKPIMFVGGAGVGMSSIQAVMTHNTVHKLMLHPVQCCVCQPASKRDLSASALALSTCYKSVAPCIICV